MTDFQGRGPSDAGIHAGLSCRTDVLCSSRFFAHNGQSGCLGIGRYCIARNLWDICSVSRSRINHPRILFDFNRFAHICGAIGSNIHLTHKFCISILRNRRFIDHWSMLVYTYVRSYHISIALSIFGLCFHTIRSPSSCTRPGKSILCSRNSGLS